MPLCFPPHRIAVPAATRAGTTKLINNSPRTTCNIRRPGISTCNAAIPAAASTPDNSAKDLPLPLPHTLQLSTQRYVAQIPPPTPAEPGQAPVSRHYSRPVVYSTSPANCVAPGFSPASALPLLCPTHFLPWPASYHPDSVSSRVKRGICFFFPSLP